MNDYNFNFTATDSLGAVTTYTGTITPPTVSSIEQTQINLAIGFLFFILVSSLIIFYFQRRFK